MILRANGAYVPVFVVWGRLCPYFRSEGFRRRLCPYFRTEALMSLFLENYTVITSRRNHKQFSEIREVVSDENMKCFILSG